MLEFEYVKSNWKFVYNLSFQAAAALDKLPYHTLACQELGLRVNSVSSGLLEDDIIVRFIFEFFKLYPHEFFNFRQYRKLKSCHKHL